MKTFPRHGGKRRPLTIVSLCHVYNERRFLRASLTHQIEQGLRPYIIDNESTDGSLDLVKSFAGRGLLGYETFPRNGKYELRKLLARSEELHSELGADWYLHYDMDQFRYAPNPYRTLAEGIAAMDALGYNCLDFDVFDFVPTEEENDFDDEHFLERMKYYYYFNCGPMHQVKAWKNSGQKIQLVSNAGHRIQFEGKNLAPLRFIQRHYYVLGKQHAIEKYCQKRFCESELASGWHGQRATLRPEDIRFPSRRLLKKVSDDNTWDTSDPWAERCLFKYAPAMSPESYKRVNA